METSESALDTFCIPVQGTQQEGTTSQATVFASITASGKSLKPLVVLKVLKMANCLPNVWELEVQNQAHLELKL